MSEPNQNEADLAAMLAVLDQPSEPALLPAEIQTNEHQTESEDEPLYSSFTLQQLEPNRRPLARTACDSCPHAVWFSTPTELRCYCRVMFLVSWDSKKPSEITSCDGPLLGME
jgi:hypothetical protein